LVLDLSDSVRYDAYRDNADDCSIRAFTVKPRAFGAPLGGVGVDRSARPSKQGDHCRKAYLTMVGSIEDGRLSDNVRQVEYWLPHVMGIGRRKSLDGFICPSIHALSEYHRDRHLEHVPTQ
jgi:hypothetical protein